MYANRTRSNRPTALVTAALPQTIRDESPVDIAFKPSTATIFDGFRAADACRAHKHAMRYTTQPTPASTFANLVTAIAVCGAIFGTVALFSLT